MTKTYGGLTIEAMMTPVAEQSAFGPVLIDLIAHIRELEAANATLTAERDAAQRPWNVVLTATPDAADYPKDSQYPAITERFECRLVDTGYSDRTLIVESEELNRKLTTLARERDARVVLPEMKHWEVLEIRCEPVFAPEVVTTYDVRLMKPPPAYNVCSTGPTPAAALEALRKKMEGA